VVRGDVTLRKGRLNERYSGLCRLRDGWRCRCGGVASLVERFSEPASLLVFFALFILVFWAGWIAAVRVTERYIVRQN
jgi:hypothetical protein